MFFQKDADHRSKIIGSACHGAAYQFGLSFFTNSIAVTYRIFRCCVTADFIDDTGSLMVNWDNGSGLNVIYGIDRVRKVVD